MLSDYQQHYNEEEAFTQFRAAILESLARIKKRLGGERYQRLNRLAESALQEHEKTGRSEAHLAWVNDLLVDYYDPMYRYQLEQKQDRIVFVGNQQEIMDYLESL